MYIINNQVEPATKSLENESQVLYSKGVTTMENSLRQRETTPRSEVSKRNRQSTIPYHSKSFSCTWVVAD